MKYPRYILSIGFLFLSLSMMAQDTLYFVKDGLKTGIRSKATYYQTQVNENNRSKKMIERQYYMTDQLKQETFYSDATKKKKEGTQKSWNPSGQLKSSVDYVDNKMHGNILTYWDNGQLKRRDVFENGLFKSGVCYNTEGVQTDHTEFYRMAEFPGGEKALVQFIKDNVRYPSVAAEQGTSGRVVVKFVILKDGNVSKIAIKTSVSPELDAQAISVVEKMPKWSPAIYDGETIDFWYILPIVYKLDERSNELNNPYIRRGKSSL